MKRLIILLTVLTAAIQWRVSAASGDLFIYPTAPDTMQALQDRCDYIVTRFWDRCNFDTGLRNPDKLNTAFQDWVALMPYASADTVYTAVDKLMARFEKKAPETLAFATMAENNLYSDTASMRAPEVYLHFAKAAAGSKKLSKAERARFQAHTQIIESSRVGATVPGVPFVKADGTKGTLDDIKNPGSILLFFNDPDCLDCRIARIRLSSDMHTNELIDKGQLTIVSIYPGETDEDGWTQAKADAPANWVTVAMPDAADYFDLRSTPAFYFLNARHKVLVADLDVDYLLGAFSTANSAQRQ